ncbi:hypothetical protein BLOT_016044 [Blomia tropicalis]|nr:hypothetical protein BLOT_016044 [Blomia tropicalis]
MPKRKRIKVGKKNVRSKQMNDQFEEQSHTQEQTNDQVDVQSHIQDLTNDQVAEQSHTQEQTNDQVDVQSHIQDLTNDQVAEQSHTQEQTNDQVDVQSHIQDLTNDQIEEKVESLSCQEIIELINHILLPIKKTISSTVSPLLKKNNQHWKYTDILHPSCIEKIAFGLASQMQILCTRYNKLAANNDSIDQTLEDLIETKLRRYLFNINKNEI